ncbi:MAG: hypothetical protein ACM3S1_06430 [Hyphomicrobiales bacterium]
MYDPEVWMELARSERRKDLEEVARYRAARAARRERGGHSEVFPREARSVGGWRWRLRWRAAEPGCEREMGIP